MQQKLQSINQFCPNSAKAVKHDSLCEYQGFTVGFCNPECRDVFQNNMLKTSKAKNYFDALIKLLSKNDF